MSGAHPTSIRGPRYTIPVCVKKQHSSTHCNTINKPTLIEPPTPILHTLDEQDVAEHRESKLDTQRRIQRGLHSIGWSDKDIDFRQYVVYDPGYMTSKVFARRGVSVEKFQRELYSPAENAVWVGGRRLKSSALRGDRGPDLRHMVFEANPASIPVLRNNAQSFTDIPVSPFPVNPFSATPRDSSESCASDGGRAGVCGRRFGIFGKSVPQGSFMLTSNSSLDILRSPITTGSTYGRDFATCGLSAGAEVACNLPGEPYANITARVAGEVANKTAIFEDSIVNAHKMANFKRYPARLSPYHGPANVRPRIDHRIPNII